MAAALILVGCQPAVPGTGVEQTEVKIPSETPEPALTVTPMDTLEPFQPWFPASIEVLEVSPNGDTVKLGFTLTNNTDYSLYILEWYTPLEGVFGEIFRVVRDGQAVPYQGILASRAAPYPEDYVYLMPGESAYSEVDLAEVYDFSQSGTYTIEFISPWISHISTNKVGMAKTMDELHPVQMPSNPVTIKIGDSSAETTSQVLPTATPRPVLSREAVDLIQSYLRIDEPLSLKDLTKDEIWSNLRVQIFRIRDGPYAKESFLVHNKIVVPIGAAYGGQGLTSLEMGDLDGDGIAELLFTSSFGSGIHQSRISMYAPAYEQYGVVGAEFGYLGDIGLFKLSENEIGVRVVEADSSDLRIRYLDTLGYLNIEQDSGRPSLVLEVLPDLPDEIMQRLYLPQTNVSNGPENIPAGLVYTLGRGEGLWIVDREGQNVMLTAHSNARLSPDRQQLLYSFEGDIYLENLVKGVKRNLTNSPDKIEHGYQWWPANPEMIVFNFKYLGEEGPSEGYLGTIDIAGIDYQVLDDSAVSFSTPALSPDGLTIAYNPLGVPTYYHLVGDIEAIKTTEYDLDVRIAASPAWSPDGRFLAWKVFADEPDNDTWSAVAVLDLAAGETNLLHKYRVLGGTNVMPGLSWSPDGRWLALLTQGEFPLETPSLWVLSADGLEEYYLGSGISPVWSPDGRWLAYSIWPSGSGHYEELKVIVLDTERLVPQLAGLPDGAVVVDWINQGA
jgi:Tol biopolymer transport system component